MRKNKIFLIVLCALAFSFNQVEASTLDTTQILKKIQYLQGQLDLLKMKGTAVVIGDTITPPPLYMATPTPVVIPPPITPPIYMATPTPYIPTPVIMPAPVKPAVYMATPTPYIPVPTPVIMPAPVKPTPYMITPTSDLTPRISMWYGKVNQHVEVAARMWNTDPDGVSDADLDKLTYCKKWYPNTTSVVEYKVETINAWHDRGNVNNYTSTRVSYKCSQDKVALMPAPYIPTPTPTIKPDAVIVRVVAPDKGENIIAGTKLYIKWEDLGTVKSGPVSLKLRKEEVICSPMVTGCQSEFIIAYNVQNTGYFEWDTNLKLSGPSTGPNSVSLIPNTKYRVGVCSGNTNICDYSDWPFNLVSSVPAPIPTPIPVPVVTEIKKSPCSPYGDINNDGYINDKDTTLIAQHIASTIPFSYDQTKRADVNMDGKVTSIDITTIKSYINGQSSSFNACYTPTLPKPEVVIPVPVPTPIIKPAEIILKTISPNGGEVIMMGTKPSIRWEDRGTAKAESVSLKLRKEGVTCAPMIIGCQNEFTIAYNVPNIGFYLWDTNQKMAGPSTGPNSINVIPNTKYRIGVCANNGQNCDYSDDAFVVIKEEPIPTPIPSSLNIKVLFPNGGESIKIGSKPQIRWENKGNSMGDNITLNLLKEGVSCDQRMTGCQSMFNIAYKIPNTGSYLWDTNLKMSGGSTGPNSISVTPNTKYRVGVCLSASTNCDYSDGAFVISSASTTEYSTSSPIVIIDPPTIIDNGCTGKIYSTTTGKLCPKTKNIYKNLQKGSTGNEVNSLQEFLGIEPTGYYGVMTTSKVMEIQIKNGLKPTGIFDSNIRSRTIFAD